MKSNQQTKKMVITIRQHGFSLLEMAIVLIIVGVMISGIFLPLTKHRELSDYAETQLRLKEIKESLIGYAIINGRLPCPTSETNPINLLRYGSADPVCSLANDFPGMPLESKAGVLPWKDLGVHEVDAWGIPRSDKSDLWTGYWMYRVANEFTSAFSLSTLTSASNIQVVKADGSSLTSMTEPAVAVICSTGKNKIADGHNASFETVNPVYQSDAFSNAFDDVCVWITRPMLFYRMVQAGKLP